MDYGHQAGSAGADNVEFSDLLAKAETYLPKERLSFLQDACDFADACHAGQTRRSGDPYIVHPLNTALFLADLHLDAQTLAACLLHDVMEDCGVSLWELEERFGPEVAKLVDGVTKLTQLDLITHADPEALQRAQAASENAGHAASLRKMLVAMAEDIRVVLIKLADRLHNMQTLDALSPERQKVIAQETLEIYAPLAHRLGIGEIKWRLEDLAFRYVNPVAYKAISSLVNEKRDEREQYVTEVLSILEAELVRYGIKAEVTGRAKHLYSAYHKMNKYAQLGRDFGEIYDLLALRVTVETVPECYTALGVVHQLWHPMPGQFDDYIASPKDNMYQSLHTTVMGVRGKPLEVQIRTSGMHELAEYGVAAHWQYKEGSAADMRFEEKMTWLRQLLEWQREVTGPEEFMEGVKLDIFQDQVFVYTPKGDIKELPAGATPIDFAYRIHTEVGHRCIGGKVNGKLAPLNYRLKNGDTVEILASKVARGPSLDWLNIDLGYVRSASARERIRQWFRKQERGTNLERGRDLVAKELRRAGADITAAEAARLMRLDTVEDLYVAVGSGSITVNQIVYRIHAAQQEGPDKRPPLAIPPVGPTSGVEVLGVGDLLTQMAQCCTPLPGDEIIGFITRTRGVSIHRQDCPNITAVKEIERLVPVNWGRVQQLHPVQIRIEAWDRMGLLRDISTLVSEERVNIASVLTQEYEQGKITFFLTLYTTGLDQLSRLSAKLEGIQGVLGVTRAAMSDAPASKADGAKTRRSKAASASNGVKSRSKPAPRAPAPRQATKTI